MTKDESFQFCRDLMLRVNANPVAPDYPKGHLHIVGCKSQAPDWHVHFDVDFPPLLVFQDIEGGRIGLVSQQPYNYAEFPARPDITYRLVGHALNERGKEVQLAPRPLPSDVPDEPVTVTAPAS